MSVVEESALESLLSFIRAKMAKHDQPLLIGIDGRSGSGKSTLAASTVQAVNQAEGDPLVAISIDADDFYRGSSGESWDGKTPEQILDDVMDWREQRNVFERLRSEGAVEWYPFDWDAENWDTDVRPVLSTPTRVHAAPVVIVEGTYACRSELRDVLDACVLLRLTHSQRRRRLLAREAGTFDRDWDTRWEACEDFYFDHVLLDDDFDLVLVAD